MLNNILPPVVCSYLPWLRIFTFTSSICCIYTSCLE